MSRCLKAYRWGHDLVAKTQVAVMVVAARSVPVCLLTGEDALDLPAGQVPGDDVVTRRFAWIKAAGTPAKIAP